MNAPQASAHAPLQAPAFAPAAVVGVSPELNQVLSTLRERHNRAQSKLAGAASPAEQEAARVLLGEVVQAAERARAMLPDPWGLRTGQALQRLVRAVALHQRETGAFPTRAALAILLETTPTEVDALLRRGQVKEWIMVTEVVEGRPDLNRWTLTEGARAYLGAGHPLLQPRPIFGETQP